MVDLAAIHSLPSVSKAIERLRSVSHRPIEIKQISDWVPTEPNEPQTLQSAAYVRTESHDVIYIDDILPEHMAVHELIHPILWAEGYPDVRLVKRPGLRFTEEQESDFRGYIDGIRDALEHHEVHRRMRVDYELDMTPYFQHKAAVHSAHLDYIVKTISRDIPFAIQKEIIDVLEMLEYRDFFGDSLASYCKATPLVMSSCEFLLAKLRPIGFDSPASSQKSYEIVRQLLVGLGTKLNMNEAENDLWKGLSFPLGVKG